MIADCFNSHIGMFFFSIGLFFVLWYFYNKNKKIGLYFTILSMIVACLSPLLTNYGPAVMMKIIFFTLFSLLLSISIQYKCVHINSILTNLLRLNIGCLIVTVQEWWIVLLLLLSTLTTPSVSVQNGKVRLDTFLVPVNPWILLSAFSLVMAYIYNPWWCTNIYLVLAALLVPTILHFTSNQFLESRMLFLCLIIWLNLLQNNEKTFGQILTSFKF